MISSSVYNSKMSLSDEEVGEDGGDQRLQELWAKKSRRRSSELKILVQDNLEIRDNSKLTMHLAKNGESMLITYNLRFYLHHVAEHEPLVLPHSQSF